MENNATSSTVANRGGSEQTQNSWKTDKSAILNADSRWTDAAVHTELQVSFMLLSDLYLHVSHDNNLNHIPLDSHRGSLPSKARTTPRAAGAVPRS